MDIVPTNKSDLSACDNLKIAQDEEVVARLNDLLGWLQDINWPVASKVLERISSLGQPLVKPVIEVLEGNDAVWKYWLISYLLPEIEIETRKSFIPVLRKMAKSPTPEEIKEEVNIVSAEALNVLV
jgi:hypothetical protein